MTTDDRIASLLQRGLGALALGAIAGNLVLFAWAALHR